MTKQSKEILTITICSIFAAFGWFGVYVSLVNRLSTFLIWLLGSIVWTLNVAFRVKRFFEPKERGKKKRVS
jgi:hypothetical protein